MKINLVKLSRRKAFFVNPKFQLVFLGFLGLLALLVICTVFAADYYFFWKFEQLGKSMGLASDHLFFQFLMQQKESMLKIFAAISIQIFVIILLFGLVFSHRIVGPLNRLQQHWNKIAKTKKVHPIRVRKEDFFQELFQAYNDQLNEQTESSKTTKH